MTAKKFWAASIGFIAAAAVAALLTALLSPASGRTFDFEVALGLFPIFFFFSMIATVILGVPIFLLLLHLRLVSWWSAVGTGLVCGAVVAVAISPSGLVTVEGLSTMGAIGGLSALAFSTVWRLGR